MVKRLAILLISCTVATLSMAANRELTVDGGDRSVRRQLSQLHRRLEGNPDWVDSLLSVAHQAGYIDAVIENRGDTVLLVLGHILHLDSLVVEGGSDLSIAVDVPFTEENWTHAVQHLIERLRDGGFYFAAVKPIRFDRDYDTIIARVEVMPGPIVTVERVVYPGIRHSVPRVLDGFHGLSPGDTITPAVLADLSRDLGEADFITLDGTPRTVPRAGFRTALVEVPIREGRQLSLEGSGGYAAGEDQGLLWSVKGRLHNIVGGGRRLDIRSERRDRRRNELEINYAQPHFAVGKGRITGSLNTRDYLDEFYEFGVSAGYGLRLASGLTVAAEVGWGTVTEAGSAPDYRRWHAGTSFRRDSRERPFNAHTGSVMSWSIEYRRRDYRGDSTGTAVASQNETRLAIGGRWWWNPAPATVLHVRADYRGLETEEDEPPVAELFLVGGPGTIRGYRTDQFAAIRTVYGSIEPRLCFADGFAFVFGDAAYIRSRTSYAGEAAMEDLYRMGFGAGLAVTDGRRAVKVSIAWNPDLRLNEPRLALELTSDI